MEQLVCAEMPRSQGRRTPIDVRGTYELILNKQVVPSRIEPAALRDVEKEKTFNTMFRTIQPCLQRIHMNLSMSM